MSVAICKPALQRCYLLKWLRVVFRTAIYCSCLLALRQMLLQALPFAEAAAAAGETSVSMLLDDRKKQPTTSLASPSRAHRRVLAADRARHQPDAEAACQRRLLWAVNNRLLVRTSAMHNT